MLLLYRVEGLNEAGDWETIRVCRLAYLKTEIVEIERYGLFNLDYLCLDKPDGRLE